jgi:GxxExxY protein
MTKKELINEGLTASVIGAFFEVYNTLGYGFYEHCYTKALEIELGLRGHTVAREVRFPVLYKGHRVGTQRVDMVVDDMLIVESKSTQDLHRGAPRQLFSYLHGSSIEVGLLLHFGPEAKFFPVACCNTGSHAITDKGTGKPSEKSPATTWPFPQGSDP